MAIFELIIVPIGAAFFGAWLAMMRFRTERWWDKKADTYVELVEALHDMGMPPAEYFNEADRGRDLPEELSKELWESYTQAKKRVWKIADSADFIISSEVFEAIQKMRTGLQAARDAVDFYQHLEETEDAVNNCLLEVKQIGAKELGIKKANNIKQWISVDYLKNRLEEKKAERNKSE